MMTAVKWLLENLISEPYSETDFKYNAECWDKAEEMEKEQIITAYNKSVPFKFGKQYYKETFNNED